MENKIGLALGGGGARGAVHVRVLEVLDEMGLQPCVISGTSIGAIVGALYGAGLSGEEIRERIEQITISEKDTWRDIFDKRKDLFKWVDALMPGMGSGGLIRTDKFVQYLFEDLDVESFDDLRVPLKIVSCDFWTEEAVVYESGPLFEPLKASMAVPGVFAPVFYQERVLIDGGVVNPVPYDLILGECDISIAVDIGAEKVRGEKEIPGVFDALLGSLQIMQRAILREKRRHARPDIYLRPEIHQVRLMQFEKIHQVYEQALPALEQFEKDLKQCLEKSGEAE
ncbi:MAG: patatin-like phospholipase family protein [Desulfobacterales bacterium]|nr:patatin-like phospholipase family protein [Desulfobacterales bacterium]